MRKSLPSCFKPLWRALDRPLVIFTPRIRNQVNGVCELRGEVFEPRVVHFGSLKPDNSNSFAQECRLFPTDSDHKHSD